MKNFFHMLGKQKAKERKQEIIIMLGVSTRGGSLENSGIETNKEIRNEKRLISKKYILPHSNLTLENIFGFVENSTEILGQKMANATAKDLRIVFEMIQQIKGKWETNIKSNTQNNIRWREKMTNKHKFLKNISFSSFPQLHSGYTKLFENWTDQNLRSYNDTLHYENDNKITAMSDLTTPNRKITVVTTAAIPWFTGTAVNPVLRAAYLSRYTRKLSEKTSQTKNSTMINNHNMTLLEGQNYIRESTQLVTLVVPWLELEEDRIELYGSNNSFNTKEEQEIHIRNWLRNEADMPDEANAQTGLKILFYPARYHNGLKSIFAMGDICSLIPDSDADICILDEPEHLNWYRAPGDGWTKKFNFVIGIVHTNYVEYASSHYSGLWTAPAIGAMSSAMVRAYCDVVIKLSDTLQTFAPEKERTSNVHGVRKEFLIEGERRAAVQSKFDFEESLSELNENTNITNCKTRHMIRSSQIKSSSKIMENTNVYYIGKILWAKGFKKMITLQEFFKQCTGEYFNIDIYGSGPDEEAIQRAFNGRRYHRRFRSSKFLNVTDKGNRRNKKSTLLSRDKNRAILLREALGKDFHTQVNEIQMRDVLKSQVAKLSNTIKSTKKKIKKSHHKWKRNPIPALLHGKVDHAALKDKYKVFLNPSVSEVLCTTTAEALAMGKFVIIPYHPSNQFFMQFPNCLAYRNEFEFAANLRWALAHEPEPLSLEQQYMFTWEAATERLIGASAVTIGDERHRKQLGTSKVDERIAWFHHEMGKGAMGDTLRKILGGGPAADQFKYENAKILMAMDREHIPHNNSENYGELFSKKFNGSVLAEAIKITFANGAFVPGNLEL